MLTRSGHRPKAREQASAFVARRRLRNRDTGALKRRMELIASRRAAKPKMEDEQPRKRGCGKLFLFTAKSWEGGKANDRANHDQCDQSDGDRKLGAGTKPVVPLPFEAAPALFYEETFPILHQAGIG